MVHKLNSIILPDITLFCKAPWKKYSQFAELSLTEEKYTFVFAFKCICQDL